MISSTTFILIGLSLQVKREDGAKEYTLEQEILELWKTGETSTGSNTVKAFLMDIDATNISVVQRHVMSLLSMMSHSIIIVFIGSLCGPVQTTCPKQAHKRRPNCLLKVCVCLMRNIVYRNHYYF